MIINEETRKIRLQLAQRMVQGPSSLDWGYSVWSWLKWKVNKDVPRTVEALKKSIKKHWKAVDEEFLIPYYNSMQNRMDALIENEGDKIDY